MSKQLPTRTYCNRNRPLPYYHPNRRTPRHWKFTHDHRTTRTPGDYLVFSAKQDDILIYGTTNQEHDERLNVVLKKFQTAQLTSNAEKCEFKERTIKFVGYIIGSNRVQADPQKLGVVRWYWINFQCRGVLQFGLQ